MFLPDKYWAGLTGGGSIERSVVQTQRGEGLEGFGGGGDGEGGSVQPRGRSSAGAVDNT